VDVVHTWQGAFLHVLAAADTVSVAGESVDSPFKLLGDSSDGGSLDLLHVCIDVFELPVPLHLDLHAVEPALRRRLPRSNAVLVPVPVLHLVLHDASQLHQYGFALDGDVESQSTPAAFIDGGLDYGETTAFVFPALVLSLQKGEEPVGQELPCVLLVGHLVVKLITDAAFLVLLHFCFSVFPLQLSYFQPQLSELGDQLAQ